MRNYLIRLFILFCFFFSFDGFSATYYSKASGSWGNAATWGTACGTGTGAVPTSSDNVIICSGNIVTMNVNGAACLSLTINGTASWSNARTTDVGLGGLIMNGGTITGSATGTLNVTGAFTTSATNNIGRCNLGISGTTTISSIVNITSAVGTKVFTNLIVTGTFNNSANSPITINGNLQNDGTYTVGSGQVTFGGATSNTITGNSTIAFNSLVINKGGSTANVIDVQAFITLTAGGLTLTNGTLKLTNSSIVITPFIVNIPASPFRIAANAGLWCNGATINSGNINWSVAGLLRVSAGTVNLGTNSDNNFLASNAGTTQLIVEGGTFNVAGRIGRTNAADVISFTVTGGTIVVPAVGSTSTTISPISIDQAGTSFTMSSGTIIIPREGGTGAQNLGFVASAGTVGISGGVIQFGDASTPASQTIRMTSSFNYANVTVNSANAICELGANLTILQALTINAGTFNCNNLTTTVGGSWTNSGTFTPGTGTVIFNGTGTQTITKSGGETFYNLTISKASGTLPLANNVQVNNSLTMIAGNIDCATNTLTLGSSTISSGTLTYTAGTIIGNFKRWVNSTGTIIIFPVGTASYTRSVAVNFTNLVGGTLTSSFVASDPGSSGLQLTENGYTVSNQFTEGYWDLTATNGLSSSNYNVDLTGNGFTSYAIIPPARVIYRANSGAPWSLNGTHLDGSGSTCRRTSVNGLSAQFALGRLVCSAYSAVSITGSTSVCTSTSQAYSVTNTSGNTYTWTITGGSVTSGQGTNSISVNWGATGMMGNVQVVESNTCLVNNTAVNLSVYVSPITTSAITGSAAVSTNEAGIVYAVINTPGYTYTWSFPSGGGTIASGQGTNSVTINWGAVASTYSVRVDATRPCGASDFKTLSVVVRAPILSNATGSWNTGGTWVGGVTPGVNDYVVIQTGHIVTMNGNVGTCYRLTINGTASWTQSRTTNVGNGGIIINSTGNISGTGAGILTSTGGLTLNSNANITSTFVTLRLQTTAQNIITSGTPGSLNRLDITTTATNTGTLTIANGGTLSGAGTLTQGVNSVFTMNGTTFSLTTLDATASGNTVEYGANANQTIRAGTYHHLKFSTSGTSNTKTLAGAITVNGNLNIVGITLDASASNYAITASGNWTNTGTFNPRFGTVNFNGSSTQTITNASGETFNNLNMSGAGSKILANGITVNVNFTLSSTLNSGTNNLNIKGNWDNSGTYISAGNTISFTNNTQLLGTSINDFNNVSITGALTGHATNMRVSGNWVNNGTFTHNSGMVTFNGTSIISGSATNTFNHLTISGALTVPAGNTNIAGDFVNNGTFNHNNGTVSFNGSTNQSIGGTSVTSFKNMTLNNSTGAGLTSAQTLEGTLTLTNGIFATNNMGFTLISNASGTARIAAIPAIADLTGEITMQRYIPAGTNGWMLLSTPVSGATLQQWNDDFVTGGFPGSQYPASTNPSIVTYDEALPGIYDDGYVTPTSITDPIIANKGYWAYILTSSPVTIDVTGSLISQTQSFPVTYTDDVTQPATEDGWNLVANPYPSTIDWDSPNWTKTNINDAIYIYNPTLDQYTSYVGGLGVNGGSNLIASSQAFLVQTNGPSPVLELTENDKTATEGTFIRSSQPVTDELLKLNLSGNGHTDETIIRFSSDASDNFDDGLDAMKFFSFNSVVPGMATIIDTLKYSVNSLPLLTSDLSIPVKVQVGVSGMYTVELDAITNVAPGSCLTLEDLLTGVKTDLRASSSYSFYINKTTIAPRFLIHIGAPVQVTQTSSLCSGGLDGRIIVKGVGNGPWDYTWKNASGGIIQTHMNTNSQDTLSGIPAGDYTVVISGNTGMCGTLRTETITLTEPDVISTLATVNNVSCSGIGDGAIAITGIYGGTPPYTYSWSNGATTSAISGLAEGAYTLTVKDNVSCIQKKEFIVTQNQSLVSAFDISIDTVNLAVNSPVLFSNVSVGAISYQWDFGDGSPVDNSEGPLHTYSIPGIYTVILIASDGMCSDTSFNTVIVISGLTTGITGSPLGNEVKIVSDNNSIDLIFNFNESTNTVVDVYNSIGQQVVMRQNIVAYKSKMSLSFADKAKGIYYIKIQAGDQTVIRKTIKL